MIPDRDRPTHVTYSESHLHVTLANGRMAAVPLADYPMLAAATDEQREQVQMSIGGLYWPALKLDISLLALLGGTPTPRRKGRICEG